MGYGDALMATAQARFLNESLKVKVAIGDGERLRWGRPEQEVFRNNPRLATEDDLKNGVSVTWAINYSGHRPYVNRELMEREFRNLYPNEKFTMKKREQKLPWRFTPWRVRDMGAGELYLTGAERHDATKRFGNREFVVIEPGTKAGASPNKQWQAAKYQELVRRLRMTFVQFNPEHHGPLPDAVPVRTASFRDACAVLSYARLYVGTEGGLHHAAAALGVPAVVYHGGYISPETTGYDGQIALYRKDGSPCGQRVHCPHCRAIAEDISVDEALEAIEEALYDR